jgi:hypothetical protein
LKRVRRVGESSWGNGRSLKDLWEVSEIARKFNKRWRLFLDVFSVSGTFSTILRGILRRVFSLFLSFLF